MKRIGVVLLTLISNQLFSQSVQWVKKGISPGFENGNAIACDDSGNVYCGGQLEFDSEFENIIVESVGSHDVLLVKYDASGQLKWIRRAGGHGGDVCNGLAVDAAHNTFVAGEMEQTADFSGQSITSAGGNDIFLAKYSSGGAIQWVKRWGDSGNDKALCAATADNGDCYIAGFFTGSVDFGSTTLNASGSRDVFIAKISSSGSVIWAKKGGGSGDDKAEGIAVDKNGDIYIVGSFTHSASFSGNSITSSGKYSAFITKYNSSGNVQWVEKGGACCDTTQFRSVAVDENNDVYVSGNFNVNADFDSFNFTASSTDCIILKYNSSGNVLWAKQGGGSDEDVAYGIKVDTINHFVYATGNVSSAGNFDNLNYSFQGFKDIFVISYDLSGNPQWVKTSGGFYRDIGSAITVDPNGFVYTTGLFNDAAHFDSFTLLGYPNQPWADFYVDKISALSVPPPTIDASNLGISNGNCTDLQVNFTPGNGTGRIVIARKNLQVNVTPPNYVYASNVYGDGQDLGNDNFVVYNGTGNSVTVSGLAPSTAYYFAVIEYNGNGAFLSYSNNSLSGSLMTPNFPAIISGISPVCTGDSVTLTASGATFFSWSPSNSLSSSSGNIVSAFPTVTTTYTVNSTDANNCNGNSEFTINVNPLPTVNFPDLADVCANDAAVALNTGTPAGGSYFGIGVSNNTFIPADAGAGTYSITYTYTDNNGCTNENDGSIHVHSTPNVTLTHVNDLCPYDAPVTLDGNHSSGTYFGTGVSGDEFDPSIGPGTYVISYSYTGSNGCSDTASINITVNNVPSVAIGNDTLICAGNIITLNAGPGYTSYHWSNGSSSSSISIDSSGSGIGHKIVIVEIENQQGCVNDDTIDINFDLCAGVSYFYNSSLKYFPNPFTDKITLSNEIEFSYSVYDITGKLLEQKENVKGETFACEQLIAGVYFIELNERGGKRMIQVVKK